MSLKNILILPLLISHVHAALESDDSGFTLRRSLSFSSIDESLIQKSANAKPCDPSLNLSDEPNFPFSDYDGEFKVAFQDKAWSSEVEIILKRAGFIPQGYRNNTKVYLNFQPDYYHKTDVAGFFVPAYDPKGFLYTPAGDFCYWLIDKMLANISKVKSTYKATGQRFISKECDELIIYLTHFKEQQISPTTSFLKRYNELVSPKLKRSYSSSALNLLSDSEDPLDFLNLERSPVQEASEARFSDDEGPVSSEDIETDQEQSIMSPLTQQPRFQGEEVQEPETLTSAPDDMIIHDETIVSEEEQERTRAMFQSVARNLNDQVARDEAFATWLERIIHQLTLNSPFISAA